MNKFIIKLKIFRAFLKLIKDPTKTEAVFKIADLGRRSQNNKVSYVIESALNNEDFKKLYKQNYLSPKIDLQKLNQLDKSSLGYAFSQHMLSHDLAVDFFPDIKIERPIDYLALRLRQTHDVWHVLAGFDISVEGEIGLQAFSLAQTNSPLAALIVAGGILHVLQNEPKKLLSLFNKIVSGYQMGKNCKFLLNYRIEEMWEENLEKLRLDFGLI